MSAIRNLVRNLRRRGVFRVAAFYIVAAWVVLQVADLALAGLGMPEIALRYVWIAVLLGFPLALVFGWRYDITPEGLVRTPVSDADSPQDMRLRHVDYALLAALSIVALIILIGLVRELPGPSVREPAPTASADPMSIAVLPLANFSGNPDQEHFVAGMHDALITVLSGISGLRVTSRTSAARFVDQDRPDIPEVGRRLGVATVLEGSVYRVDETVRINVQLVRTDSDEQIWAHAYERDIRDILALQNDVAQAVAGQVEVALTPVEKGRLRDPGRVEPQVYELYQQGLFRYRQFTPEAVGQAEDLFRQALAMDPDFARAHLGLGMARQYAWEYGGSTDRVARDEVLREAIRSAERALELDPNLAEAHMVLAYARSFVPGQKAFANDAIERALKLSPSLAMAHHMKALRLMLDGDVDAAIREQTLAVELDPLNDVIVGQAFATYYYAGVQDEALRQINSAIELSPDNLSYRVYRGRVYLELDRLEEALDDFEQALAGIPESNWMHAWTQVFIAQTHARDGQTEVALRWLETIRTRSDGYAPPVGLAMVYTAMGRPSEAIDYLEQGYESNEEQIFWITDDPAFDPLRDNQRFTALVERVRQTLQQQ